jgi:hypothetical protein
MDHQTYDQVLDWIAQQTTAVAACRYGRNTVSIQQGLQDQSHRQTVVDQFEDTVSKTVDEIEDAEKKKSLKLAYDNLKLIISKKIHCLEMMLSVTSLEENCSRVSRDMDERAASLTKPLKDQLEQPSQQQTDAIKLPGFIGVMSQDCIFGLRDNWNWVTELVKCVDIHLKNAGDYHQFFHEVKETEPWLLEDICRLSTCLDTFTLDGSEETLKKITEELQGAYTSLRLWEAKVDRLWDVAVKLVPLTLRIDGVKEPTPSRALCDYETAQISVRANEDILLLDNSSPRMWKVRNGRGQEAELPGVIVLIPGPDLGAIEAAARLRLQLLTAWTNAVKRIGARLIGYLLVMFKHEYNQHEISVLTSSSNVDKHTLLELLTFIEDTLKKHWADHDGFIGLQERILALRMILEEAEPGDQQDETLFKSVYLQITTLAKLIEIYQAMFRDWEKFKVALEASRAPELMLIVDKWEQLQFVTREYFAKFWKTKLPLEGVDTTMMSVHGLSADDVTYEDLVDMGLAHQVNTGSMQVDASNNEISVTTGGEGGSSGEGFDETKTTTVTAGGGTGGKREVRVAHIGELGKGIGQGSGAGEDGSSGEGMEEIREITETRVLSSKGIEHEGTDFGVATERKTAETEQLMAAEVEEKKTFVIQSVISPVDKTEISLQQAIMLGIIRPDEGVYVNSVTGETKPIVTAMTEGLIKVMFSTTKRSQEKTSSIGIITVKTIREPVRPYKILSIKDPKTGKDITPDEAIGLGILDQRQGSYTDRHTGKRLLVTEAAEAGLIKLEYTGETPEPEVVSKTYAVRAVVDRRQKKTVTFHEAVRRGIIDRDSGAFRDTLTGDKMYVGDAIMRGFLKARIIEDATGLNIDPENRMVIDKTEKIRKRLLKPLGVISAFKLAAAAASSPKAEVKK